MRLTPDSDWLSRYLGVYQIAPNFALTIALQGDHLTAQGTNQPAAPIYVSSPTRFFLRVVDAEIEFFSDGRPRDQGSEAVAIEISAVASLALL
jgi:hypothetical protein